MNSQSIALSSEWATNVMNDLSVDDRQIVFDMWRAIRMSDQDSLQLAVNNFPGDANDFQRLVAGVGAMRHFIEDEGFSLAVLYRSTEKGGKLAIKLHSGQVLRSSVRVVCS